MRSLLLLSRNNCAFAFTVVSLVLSVSTASASVAKIVCRSTGVARSISQGSFDAEIYVNSPDRPGQFDALATAHITAVDHTGRSRTLNAVNMANTANSRGRVEIVPPNQLVFAEIINLLLHLQIVDSPNGQSLSVLTVRQNNGSYYNYNSLCRIYPFKKQ